MSAAARERQAARYTILLIEHDMDVVFSLADRISVLVGGRIIASGTADEIRNHPDVRVAYLGEEDDDLGGDLMLTVEGLAPATARARSCSASTSRCAAARW